MSKIIENGSTAREKLITGINKLSDLVVSTLGPNGRNIVFVENGEVRSTKDGVTVAKNVVLEDPIENLGADMVKQASLKTADVAGDGTTTSTLLTREIINEGVKHVNNGSNVVELKKGIDFAVNKIIENLSWFKEEISSEDQLKQIATISSNNDSEAGNLIATAISKVGREGIVHIEESNTDETRLETVEGMQFDKGWKSHFFVTNENTMTTLLEDPLILIVDKKLTPIKELLGILERAASENKPLLVVAEDIDGEALSTMIVNKIRGIIKICAVKAPDFGDRRKLILEDLAILTGGKVVTADKGMLLEEFDTDWFGRARTVTVSKDQTTIVDGKGDEKEIKERIEAIQKQIENSVSQFEKEKLQERLSKLVGGVAIIFVGGTTETEIKEKKDRVEDALYATKAAVEEGIIPGGGSALIHSVSKYVIENGSDDFILGQKIVINACQKPFSKILENAGYETANIYNLLNTVKNSDSWTGFDLKSNSTLNMKTVGIIDPFKVTRVALQNAASVASTVLLTEGIIIEKPKVKEQNDLGNMGGMF